MLRCVSRYQNKGAGLAWEPGELVTGLDAAQESWLMDDSPGSFEVVTEPVKALAGPPADKRQRAAVVKAPSAGESMSRASMPGLTRG